MATIGQALVAPESGWKRFDDNSNSFEYIGDWTLSTTSSHYSSTAHVSVNRNSKVNFFFTGEKIRVICYINNTRSNDVVINIDGVEESFSTAISTNISSGLVYEKLNLKKGGHSVSIYSKSDLTFVLDAVDIDEDGELRTPYRKAIIKNPTTNQHYSLAEKTLIPLPDSLSKNMILHGIEAGKEIQLDVDFDKINYINTVSGKIVKQKLDKNINKILGFKEV